LRPAVDAVRLDSTVLDAQQVLGRAIELVRARAASLTR